MYLYTGTSTGWGPDAVSFLVWIALVCLCVRALIVGVPLSLTLCFVVVQLLERQRVRKAGGEVVMKRVNGELAVCETTHMLRCVQTYHAWLFRACSMHR